MRQIPVGAWLLASLAVVACSGEQFTSTKGTPTGTSLPAADLSGGSEGGDSSSAEHDPEGPSKGAGDAGKSAGGASAAVGGGSSAGTSTSSGGASSAGNPAHYGGGVGSAACASGTITFRMLPAPGLTPDFLCDAGCGTGWLTLTDADGTTAFSVSSACGTASCETCEVQTCGAAACLPTPLTAKGSELSWSGTYLAKDTCGDNMACQRQACVKPGKYKARACAALNQGPNTYGGCTPREQQLCAEVEFDFPGSTTVELRLEN